MQQFPLYERIQGIGALQIKHIAIGAGGISTVYPVDAGYEAICVNSTFLYKYQPKPGGYLIQLDNGELGYVEKEVFEDEFTAVNP